MRISRRLIRRRDGDRIKVARKEENEREKTTKQGNGGRKSCTEKRRKNERRERRERGTFDFSYNYISLMDRARMANPLSSFSLDYRYFLRLVANKDVEVSAFEEIKRAVDARKYCQFVRNSETPLYSRSVRIFIIADNHLHRANINGAKVALPIMIILTAFTRACAL